MYPATVRQLLLCAHPGRDPILIMVTSKADDDDLEWSIRLQLRT